MNYIRTIDLHHTYIHTYIQIYIACGPIQLINGSLRLNPMNYELVTYHVMTTIQQYQHYHFGREAKKLRPQNQQSVQDSPNEEHVHFGVYLKD